MPEHRLQGRAASPGFAEGVLVPVGQRQAGTRAAGSPADEAALLRTALDDARVALDALAGAEPSGSPIADMLGFQLAILDDDALREPAFARIEAGMPADAAWTEAIEAEIALLLDGADESFAARAADYRDLRDRVIASLNGDAVETVQPGGILVGRDVGPSVFLGCDWGAGGGIAVAEGSPASHVAMLARARGVPMVTGLGPGLLALAGPALLDGTKGILVTAPEPTTLAAFHGARSAAGSEARAAQEGLRLPARTADGVPVRVLVNLGAPDELDGLDPAICDGAGLVRTEFLFHAGRPLPDEDTQFAAYARLVRWAAGRPVTIRTLDAGGDKPIPGLTGSGESNPFLGLRGIRLSIARPDVFRVQLRALLRAAALGPVKVMLPMVAVPAELEAARALMREEAASLGASGVEHAVPPLGIMVEVPAAALALERFDAAFFSIGSNDLTQYTMAAARDIGSVAALNDPLEPAVLRLVAETAAAAERMGREVTLCGDAGGDPVAIPALLQAGLRALSMAPARVGAAKQAIGRIRIAAP